MLLRAATLQCSKVKHAGELRQYRDVRQYFKKIMHFWKVFLLYILGFLASQIYSTHHKIKELKECFSLKIKGKF